MARCDYKIVRAQPIGYGRMMVDYVISEGDVSAENETVVAANGTSSTQSVTRYRRTSVLASGQINVGEASVIADMNALLKTHETGSRTAIDEQAS